MRSQRSVGGASGGTSLTTPISVGSFAGAVATGDAGAAFAATGAFAIGATLPAGDATLMAATPAFAAGPDAGCRVSATAAAFCAEAAVGVAEERAAATVAAVVVTECGAGDVPPVAGIPVA